MAWIESHQELGRHPKTKRFARAAGISLPTAIGHLQFLWWWAIDYAQDGNLSNYTAEDIADATCWDGDPDMFLNALVSAGFVDMEDNRMSIHDWTDYAGKLLERRASDRERKRKPTGTAKKSERIQKEFRNNSDGVPAETARLPYVPYLTVPYLTVPNPTVPNPTVPNPTVPNPTVPNPTVPNPTVPNPTKILPPTPEVGECDGVGDEKPAEKPQPMQQVRFDEFWQSYPKKVGKTAAREAWSAIKPDKVLLARMLSTIETTKSSEQWQREGGRFIPDPANWLAQGRWDDEVLKPPDSDTSFTVSEIEAVMRQNTLNGTS